MITFSPTKKKVPKNVAISREGKNADEHIPNRTMKSTIFQDVLEGVATEDDVSNAFFELANAPLVVYRFSNGVRLQIQQDSEVHQQHTGGIVWETSVLLLNYLLSSKKDLGEYVLELGAGCGLLGLGLAQVNDEIQVTITDTAQVVAQVHQNVAINNLKEQRRIQVCPLDWTRFRQDATLASLSAASFDTIVATDVLFSPDLVQPLLETMQHFSKPSTCMYLCVQIRCARSHALFLERLKEYGWRSIELTDELRNIKACAWGRWMGCHLFQLSRIESTTL